MILWQAARWLIVLHSKQNKVNLNGVLVLAKANTFLLVVS